MKSMGINSYSLELLKYYMDQPDKSYDHLINILISDVGNEMPSTLCGGKHTAIKVRDETLKRLKSYALTDGESYENILIRMLLMAEDLNTYGE